MDRELLMTLGLDPDKDRKGILEDLEGKQYEFFERLETAKDDARREELTSLLSRIDAAISQIKEELAAMDSAIILDTAAPQTEKEAAQEQKKQETEKKKREKEAKAQKEAELAAQVQALKEKEEEKRKAEEKAAQEKAEQEKKEQEQKAAAAAAQAPAPQPQPTSELQQGLLRYHKQNYTGAFPIFKKLSEENDPTAQYMLACMYDRGEGIAKDKERAEFWMKKAADKGDAVAQLDYGLWQLADSSRDDKKTAIGADYLKKSADQNNRDAMLRYVELVESGYGDRKENKIARGYCSKLMQLIEDSYDRQHYEHLAQQMKIKQRKLNRRHFGQAASNVTGIVGALILMMPTLLIFAAFHQEYLQTLPVLCDLPMNVQQILYNSWHISGEFQELPDALNALTAVQNVMLMLVIGWMIKGASYKENRNGLTKSFVRFGIFLRYGAIVGHFALCSMLNLDPFFQIELVLVPVLAAIIVGRILGAILSKILGTKCQ